MEHTDEVHPLVGAAIKDKFVAWWNGYDSVPLWRFDAVKSRLADWWRGEAFPDDEIWDLNNQLPVRKAEAPNIKKQDISARLIVAQALWGEGNVTPGSADYITRPMILLRLSSEMSMLDLGAGLGGPSRAIHAAFGIWVTALEWEAEIAAAGMQQSVMYGMGRKVPVSHFDPGNPQNQLRKIDCFFSKDSLHLIEDKQYLLSAVKSALKQRGQFCIMDYVLTDQGRAGPHIAAWNEADEHVSHFWTCQHYMEAFRKLKLHLRVNEDLTASYSEMIAEGFHNLRQNMDGLIAAESDPGKRSDLHRALAFEANRWAVRAEALQAGHVAVQRFMGDTG